VSRWLHQTAAIVPWLEPLALAVAAPFLFFPATRSRRPAVMLTVSAAFYLLRWIVRREPWSPTPFNGALLLLALVIPVAVGGSAPPDLTLPKITGLILGLGDYRAIAFAVHDRRSFLWGVTALARVGRDLTHGPLRFVYHLLLVDHALDVARVLGRGRWLGNPCSAPGSSAFGVARTGVT
jgi:hypothetical protein